MHRLLLISALVLTSFASASNPPGFDDCLRTFAELHSSPDSEPTGAVSLETAFSSGWYRVFRNTRGVSAEDHARGFESLLASYREHSNRILDPVTRQSFLLDTFVWANDLGQIQKLTHLLREGDTKSLNVLAAQMRVFGTVAAMRDRQTARDYLKNHFAEATTENYDPEKGTYRKPIEVKPKKHPTAPAAAPPIKTSLPPGRDQYERVKGILAETKRQAFIDARDALEGQGIKIVREYQGIRFNGEYTPGEGVFWLQDVPSQSVQGRSQKFEMDVARNLSKGGEELLGLGDEGVRYAFHGPLKPDERRPPQRRCADFVSVHHLPADAGSVPKTMINVREAKYFRDDTVFEIPLDQLRGALDLVLARLPDAEIGQVEAVIPMRDPEKLLLPDGVRLSRRYDVEHPGEQLYDLWITVFDRRTSKLKEVPLKIVTGGKGFVVGLRMI